MIEWRLVSPEEAEEQQRLDEENMPPELSNPCPFCGSGKRYWCMTRNGNWAVLSHKKRLLLLLQEE